MRWFSHDGFGSLFNVGCFWKFSAVFLSFSFPLCSYVVVKKKKKTQIKNSTSTNYGGTYCFSRPPTRDLYEALPAGRATRLAIGWPGRLVQRTIKEVAGRTRARARVCLCVRLCVCVCVCVRACTRAVGRERSEFMSKIHFLYLWASLIGPPASPPISAEDTVLAQRPWIGLDIPSGSKGRHPGLNELLCVRMSY